MVPRRLSMLLRLLQLLLAFLAPRLLAMLLPRLLAILLWLLRLLLVGYCGTRCSLGPQRQDLGTGGHLASAKSTLKSSAAFSAASLRRRHSKSRATAHLS